MTSADPRDLEAILQPGEAVVATGWGEVAMPRQGLMTIAPIGGLIRLWYLVLNKKRSSDLRRKTAGMGMPLDRHMGLVLTTHRLLRFRASRLPRRRKELLGETDVDAIASAALPYISSGPMKTIAITLRTGTSVRFRVDGALADALVKRFG